MQKGKLNVVIDGQWGSTGKGKLCDWLTRRFDPAVVVCDFQTNAGHTVVMDDGTKHVFQQLPVAAVSNNAELLVNAGATITVKKLLEEIETHKCAERVTIHPHAAIVTAEAIAYEREHLNRISSTLKGCGATLGMKAMRHPGVVLAKDVPELKDFIGDTTEILHRYLRLKAVCFAESAQGLDLSINHGHLYPYVTSRDVTTASVLSNAGVPPQLVGDVWGCLRTFPIRVGNSFDADGKQIGTSGPYYDDQKELTWEEMKQIAGGGVDLTEKTTVTQKVRRIFTFSNKQFQKFNQICGPTHLFINFVNYLDHKVTGVRHHNQLTVPVQKFLVKLLEEIGVGGPIISLVGTGPKTSDVVEICGLA
jgi:adenylosuccinate synthase